MAGTLVAEPRAPEKRGEKHGFGVTQRRDNWWLQPLAVFLGLSAFVVYATWAAFQGKNFEWGPYISPFYSPLINPRWFGLTISPALLILWAPGGFRVTCYYYRKAYYRAFFLDPPACAVGEFSEHRYCGEAKFPYILQNVHRYFFYLAVIVLGFLWYDAVVSFIWNGHFGMGIGSLVLTMDAFLLSGYTFGCHSLRHLIGGRLDNFHGGACEFAHSCWSNATRLNEHHMLWAWISLCWVAFSDFYVRMVAAGIFHDLRIF